MRLIYLAILMLLLISCEQQMVKVYLTTGDKQKLLNEEFLLNNNTDASASGVMITLDSTQKLQSVDGFGAALTGSAAYLINRRLNNQQRDSLLNTLFAPAGIGISYLRVTMGASDFSLRDFTYNDMPAGQTDPLLSNFSIEPDREDLIPVLKKIIAINPSIKIMATPWSAPAWMKTNQSLKGGELQPEYYASYANYFVKYIKAYEAEGIPIAAVTPQNEPLHHVANYPCMSMSAAQQLDFVKNHLGPAFQADGITTGIMLYDHNWDNTEYAISILNDTDVKKFVVGTAFHAYAGSVSAMGTVHQAHPDKALYFTEISGGRWATNFSDNLMWNLENIFIGTMNNWSKNALLWNLALDQEDGPTNNGCDNCRGVVTIDNVTGAVTKNEEFYALAHFSKFVKPGAFRISNAELHTQQFHYVAFVNPDGSKAMIASNNDQKPFAFSVKEGANQFSYTIPAKAVVTLVW
ncbi:MAG: glucosylceramidase [Bacteroidota bacterium]|nr:MAG: glucosylceramidase [Bacteroidota bacterium]